MEHSDSALSLKEFLISLKCIYLRNVAHKSFSVLHSNWNGYSETVSEGRSNDLPILICKVIIRNNDEELLYSLSWSAPSASLNPTWSMSETDWLSIPSSMELHSISQITVEIYEVGRDSCLVSFKVDLSELTGLPANLNNLSCLPLNSLFFELTDGRLLGSSECVDSVGRESKLFRAASRSRNVIDHYIPSIPGPFYDQNEIISLDKLRLSVESSELEAEELFNSIQVLKSKNRSHLCDTLNGIPKSSLDIESLREELEKEKKKLEREEHAIENERIGIAQQMKYLSQLSTTYNQLRRRCVDLDVRRKSGDETLQYLKESLTEQENELTGLLQRMFQIRYDPISKGYLIRNILLDLESRDDDILSAALGYTAHVTALAMKYLNVNSRYKIHCRASRSTISDTVSESPPFPLFRRGVELDKFEKGVFCLSRTIKQLLEFRGLVIPERVQMAGGVGGDLLVPLQYLLAECARMVENRGVNDGNTSISSLGLLGDEMKSTIDEDNIHQQEVDISDTEADDTNLHAFKSNLKLNVFGPLKNHSDKSPLLLNGAQS